MIKSMTGYGCAKGIVEGLELTVELKSVNNRYLDVSVRLPRSFIFAEDSIKKGVSGHISRGKVDVFVTVDSSKADNFVINMNEPLAEAYISGIKGLSDKYGIPFDLSALSLAKLPDVMTVEKKEADRDAIVQGLGSVLEEALCGFDAMRLLEGEKLMEDILNRLNTIEELTAFVEQRSPETVSEYREKLEQRMMAVLENTEIDQTRILTEAAIFADKVAVDEETVRLRSHICQLREMIKGDSPVGRKLDFLIQELNREANTTGSKCNDAVIAKAVIDMKAEIEKIREQVQNIE